MLDSSYESSPRKKSYKLIAYKTFSFLLANIFGSKICRNFQHVLEMINFMYVYGLKIIK